MINKNIEKILNKKIKIVKGGKTKTIKLKTFLNKYKDNINQDEIYGGDIAELLRNVLNNDALLKATNIILKAISLVLKSSKLVIKVGANEWIVNVFDETLQMGEPAKIINALFVLMVEIGDTPLASSMLEISKVLTTKSGISILKRIDDVEFNGNNFDDIEKNAEKIFDDINSEITDKDARMKFYGVAICTIQTVVKDLYTTFKNIMSADVLKNLIVPFIKDKKEAEKMAKNLEKLLLSKVFMEKYFTEFTPDAIKTYDVFKKMVKFFPPNLKETLFGSDRQKAKQIFTSIITIFEKIFFKNETAEHFIDNYKPEEYGTERSIKDETKKNIDSIISIADKGKLSIDDLGKVLTFIRKSVPINPIDVIKNLPNIIGQSLAGIVEYIKDFKQIKFIMGRKIIKIKSDIGDIVNLIPKLFAIFLTLLKLQEEIFDKIEKSKLPKITKFCNLYNQNPVSISEPVGKEMKIILDDIFDENKPRNNPTEEELKLLTIQLGGKSHKLSSKKRFKLKHAMI